MSAIGVPSDRNGLMTSSPSVASPCAWVAASKIFQRIGASPSTPVGMRGLPSAVMRPNYESPLNSHFAQQRGRTAHPSGDNEASSSLREFLRSVVSGPSVNHL